MSVSIYLFSCWRCFAHFHIAWGVSKTPEKHNCINSSPCIISIWGVLMHLQAFIFHEILILQLRHYPPLVVIVHQTAIDVLIIIKPLTLYVLGVHDGKQASVCRVERRGEVNSIYLRNSSQMVSNFRQCSVRNWTCFRRAANYGNVTEEFGDMENVG